MVQGSSFHQLSNVFVLLCLPKGSIFLALRGLNLGSVKVKRRVNWKWGKLKMFFRDKKTAISSIYLCVLRAPNFIYVTRYFLQTKQILHFWGVLIIPIAADRDPILSDAKNAGVSEHPYLPLTNLKQLKLLFRIAYTGMIRIYLSRTAKSFCCSRAWTNVTRKCLLLRRVENRVIPSSTLGLVVLVAWRHDDGWNRYSSAWQTCSAHARCVCANPFHHLSVSSDPSVEHFIFLATAFNSAGTSLLRPLSVYLSRFHLTPCDCLLNVQSWLNEPGLSMGATKQQHDGDFPLDCIHMVWFAAWQKESRGVH